MTPKQTMLIKLGYATAGLLAVVILTLTGHATSDVISYIKWGSVALIGGTALVGAASQKETP